jgi:hypothetical protein
MRPMPPLWMRYPHLERVAGTPELLDELLSPRK